jgi:hypothetical protein
MKQPSPLVDNKKFQFDEKQISYIAKSHKDAVKAGYIEVGEKLVAERPPKSLQDLDKCQLFLPQRVYKDVRSPWDSVPL